MKKIIEIFLSKLNEKQFQEVLEEIDKIEGVSTKELNEFYKILCK